MVLHVHGSNLTGPIHKSIDNYWRFMMVCKSNVEKIGKRKSMVDSEDIYRKKKLKKPSKVTMKRSYEAM